MKSEDKSSATGKQSVELRPVEIVGNHWIHRDASDGDATFYRRDEVDRQIAELKQHEIDALYPAFALGNDLLRFDGSEWDRAIREYQGRIAELKDALQRGGGQQ